MPKAPPETTRPPLAVTPEAHRHPLLTYRLTGPRDTWSVIVSDGPGLTAVEVLVPQVCGVDQQRWVSAHPQAEGRALELVKSRWPPGLSREDEAPTQAIEHIELAADIESLQARRPPGGDLGPAGTDIG